ncbi:MAG TPA: hypothetical protein DCR43_05605 [Bacteroidales bacterium]|nr:hypothetical protein [Bacteroidales bacterium]HBZ65425.1 hypothetical protein [Bacteroidales bacterium]
MNTFLQVNFLTGCVIGRCSISRIPDYRVHHVARSTSLIRLQRIATNTWLVNKPLNLNSFVSFRLSGTPQFPFELTCSPNLHANPFSKMDKATMPVFNVVCFVDKIPNLGHFLMLVSPSRKKISTFFSTFLVTHYHKSTFFNQLIICYLQVENTRERGQRYTKVRPNSNFSYRKPMFTITMVYVKYVGNLTMCNLWHSIC